MQNQPTDMLADLQRFQGVLAELQASHARLESQARRLSAELEVSNRALELKVAELDRTNQFLEAILSSLPTGVIVRNAEHRIVRTNRACQQILDMPAETLLDTTEELPIDGSRDGKQWNIWITPGGEPRTVTVGTSEVHDQAGQSLGCVEILSDQTELAETTRRMHQQSKMAALGTMAGGIAHEIRNPMNAVRGFAGLLNRPGITEENRRRYADAIERGVVEVEGIIRGLLRLANPSDLDIETLDSRELFENALERVQSQEMASGIEWSSEMTAVAFPGDRVQLRQALRNLIANAVQAQNGQGRVHVACTACEGEVRFEIHDGGPGFTIASAEQWVDPFFTTRADGMGLGLALVDRIARLHHGRLQISPAPSHLGGACVRLCLPTS
ncbi:MAG: ATP-binding protein [Planctomycetota bacterium]